MLALILATTLSAGTLLLIVAAIAIAIVGIVLVARRNTPIGVALIVAGIVIAVLAWRTNSSSGN